MVLSKYTPAERLVRKRLAARLRQQRCRARKRAMGTSTTKEQANPGDNTNHAPAHPAAASGLPSHHHHHHPHMRGYSSSANRSPNKIVVLSHPPPRGMVRYPPPQPRSLAGPPYHPHTIYPEHASRHAHYNPVAGPPRHHRHHSQQMPFRAPPPHNTQNNQTVVYEGRPPAFVVPPGARVVPAGTHPGTLIHAQSSPPQRAPPAPHHPYAATSSSSNVSAVMRRATSCSAPVHFPAVVSRTSSHDETSTIASSPESSPAKRALIDTLVEPHKQQHPIVVASPPAPKTTKAKTALWSKEKAAIDAMLCLGKTHSVGGSTDEGDAAAVSSPPAAVPKQNQNPIIGIMVPVPRSTLRA